jgi:membrane protein
MPSQCTQSVITARHLQICARNSRDWRKCKPERSSERTEILREWNYCGFLSLMSAKVAIALLKETYTDWNEDKAPRLGAALAYYTVFSIAPLLVVLIAVAGIFFGQEAARGQISSEISRVVGPQAAEFLEAMIEGARKPSDSIFATVIGLVTLLLGAMGVFGQLQDALNTIWEVQPKPGRTFIETIKDRLTPFAMVIGVSFLLLTSLVATAAINALANWMNDVLPLHPILLQAINLVLGFALITVMFALIFKVLPDVKIQWHDVWIGAALTAVLFLVGQLGLAWYVGKSATSSTYGAAGSLVAVLLWVYWTSQILFFGAEFTQVYATKFGSRIEPSANAVPLTAEARANQCMTRAEESARIARETKKERAPQYRNLLEESRQESAHEAPHRSSGANAMMEDVGAALAGLGIVLILSRLFHKGDQRS